MQFNPVVLSVEMPVCKIFVTKIQKTGRIWTNYTKKQKAKIKKRASSLEPLASCKKSQKAFLFYLHQIVTRKSIFLFTPKKTNFNYLSKHLMF